MGDTYDHILDYDEYAYYNDPEVKYDEQTYAKAVKNEKYWTEQLEKENRWKWLDRFRRKTRDANADYIRAYSEYWTNRAANASKKRSSTSPSTTPSKPKITVPDLDSDSDEETKIVLSPFNVRRGWRHDKEYSQIEALTDPESELGLKQASVLDKEAQSLPLTEEDEEILKGISGVVLKQTAKNKEQREKAKQRLIAKGRTPEDAELLVHNEFDNYDTLGERFLDSFNKKMQTFKNSSWGKSGIGKKISDFHTLHGDAASLGAGAAAIGAGALGGFLLYKGAKKLFGKKKEPEEEEEEEPNEPSYNQMPTYMPPDQNPYPYPFPMSDLNYQLPPSYYEQTPKIHVSKKYYRGKK